VQELTKLLDAAVEAGREQERVITTKWLRSAALAHEGLHCAEDLGEDIERGAHLPALAK
jgi:hypothetical protein